MDNSPEKESPDAPTQLRALADDKMAATCAYASDLRHAADEIERLRAERDDARSLFLNLRRKVSASLCHERRDWEGETDNKEGLLL